MRVVVMAMKVQGVVGNKSLTQEPFVLRTHQALWLSSELPNRLAEGQRVPLWVNVQ